MVNVAQHRRLPVGAELQPVAFTFASGHPITAASRSSSKRAPAARPVSSPRPRARWLLLRHVPQAARRHALPLPPRRRRDALSRPGLALPARRPARPLRGRRPARRSAGPTRDWRGRRLAGPGDLRDARRHVHAARAPGPPPRASCPRWPTLGITVIELMPVAEFPGRFGWGYDGVDLFAPTRLYGTPGRLPPLRRRAPTPPGLGVILDVVYNHLGPDGNYLDAVLRPTTSPTATRTSGARRSTSTAPTPARCASSSSRTPATGSTSSTSTACGSTRRRRSSTPRPTHILAAIGRAAREAARRARRSSSSPRTSRRTRGWSRPAEQGGYGLDALWNDDFHHSAMVAAHRPQRGLLHRLPRHAAGVHLRRQVRLPLPGPALHLAEEAPRHARRSTCRRRAFVTFLQNHDQVANSARGQRAAPADQPRPLPRDDRAAAARAGHADAVPGPGVRRLDARSSTSPTTTPSCAQLVRQGPRRVPRAVPQPRRRREMQARPARPRRPRRPSSAASSTSPSASATPTSTQLHRDLLRLRREDPVFRRAAAGRRRRRRARAGGVRAALLRRRTADDRLLLVNLGRDLHLDPAPEPLLAPPDGTPLGARSGRARTRATAAAAPAPLGDRRTAGASPARPRSSLRPCRTRERRAMTATI